MFPAFPNNLRGGIGPLPEWWCGVQPLSKKFKMEINSNQNSRNSSSRKGHKNKKPSLSYQLVQGNSEQNVKFFSKHTAKPVKNIAFEPTDYPVLPNSMPECSANSLGFGSTDLFSKVLKRQPVADCSNSKVTIVTNHEYRSSNKYLEKGKPTQSFQSRPQKLCNNVRTSVKTEINLEQHPNSTFHDKHIFFSSECQTDKKINVNTSEKKVCKVENGFTPVEVKNEKIKTKRKKKKAAEYQKGKVNTISHEQYLIFTETSIPITPNQSFQSSIHDEQEYPVLGAKFITKPSRAKSEPALDQSDIPTELSQNVKREKDADLPNGKHLSGNGGIVIGELKLSPKLEKSSQDKKFNSPIQMNLVDMLSNIKIKPSKKNHKFQPLCVKREKVKSPSKHGHLNVLDSSGPTRKRGKEREIPRKPKLSRMKKVILKERVERKLRISGSTETKCEEKEKQEENEVIAKELESEMQNLNLLSDDQRFSPLQTTELKPQIPIKTELEKEQEELNLRLKCSKKLLHCRRFREYCNHFISEEMDTLTNSLLGELVRYQDRLFQKDPVKARARKRLVCGLKEVTKNLRLRKLKLIIVAPDIEEINSEGGLNDALEYILDFCANYNTSLVFSLPRRKLGKVCKKKVPLSCVGIFNYEGTEEIYKQLMELVEEAKQVYKETLKFAQNFLSPEAIQILSNDHADNAQIEELRTSFWQH